MLKIYKNNNDSKAKIILLLKENLNLKTFRLAQKRAVGVGRQKSQKEYSGILFNNDLLIVKMCEQYGEKGEVSNNSMLRNSATDYCI